MTATRPLPLPVSPASAAPAGVDRVLGWLLAAATWALVALIVVVLCCGLALSVLSLGFLIATIAAGWMPWPITVALVGLLVGTVLLHFATRSES